MSNYIGKKVIVRADRAGVFYGELVEQKEKSVVMKNVRKLWYWDGAAAVEELAVSGTIEPDECKFTVSVAEMEINQWIQILPCTKKSQKSIEGVKIWKRG